MTSPFRWPLATSPWTLADKLAIAKWLVTSNRYTMGDKVRELEERFSEYSGMHALMVANGSVANQLVFELWKLKHPGVKPVVIVPAVTWVSSITPALMAGMDVVFSDIGLTDFALDCEMAEKLVKLYRLAGREVILWPTALIGYAPDMDKLQRIADENGAYLYLDSCENTFGKVNRTRRQVDRGVIETMTLPQSILASADMTTTSLYMSHQASAIEGGLVFFKSQEDCDYARMFRNHGLSRSLLADHPTRRAFESQNPEVDPQFLFALPGTNLRPTDVHAMFGLMDFKRVPEATEHRRRLYRLFHETLDKEAFYLPPLDPDHVGFCFPIFVKNEALLPALKGTLAADGIETRPIIGGCLPGLQPIFKDYGKPEDFPNALWVHRHGTYVGCHLGVTEHMVFQLTDLLNSLAAGQTERKAA